MNLTLSMFVALYSFQKCPFIIIISCDHKMVVYTFKVLQQIFRRFALFPKNSQFKTNSLSEQDKKLLEVFRLGEGSPSKEFPCSGFSVKEKTLHSVEKKKKEKKKVLASWSLTDFCSHDYIGEYRIEKLCNVNCSGFFPANLQLF